MMKLLIALIFLIISTTVTVSIHGNNSNDDHWFGYKILEGTLHGNSYKVVFPNQANRQRDWIWRARFWGHEPQTDIALLAAGFHVAYIEVGGLFGSPKALRIWDEFYSFIIEHYQLNPKVVLEGMSRGGLTIFNWGNKHADKVACIYGDAPVCDFKSWPGGQGNGPGSSADWKICLEQYGLTEEEARLYVGNPVDHMENIAKHKVPILMVVGNSDKVVPVSENTQILGQRLNELGWELQVLYKPNVGHHPHALKDPKLIVDFILMHTGNMNKNASLKPQWSTNNRTVRGDFNNSRIQFEVNKKGHVAFIGGSITEMNGYRPMLSNYLREKFPDTDFTFTNAGVSSTGSTTGAFRMERDVLSKGPVDLLFIEFAVNDDQDAAHTFEKAILGMEGIIRKARNHNPEVNIIMTYFVNPAILQDYQNGKVRTSIAAHESVAKHYNITTCNLAKEVADQITVGILNWESFGGTHPNDLGNAICANMISSMLEKAWSEKSPIPNPVPISAYNYENGGFVSPKNCEFDSKWTYDIPNWEQIDGNNRKRFANLKILSTIRPGAALTLEFTGTVIGVYLLAGPDAGMIKVSIDGGEYLEFDLFHKFSKELHYPRTLLFSNKLSHGPHIMKLRMLEKSTSKGTAIRIMNFVVN